MRDIASGVSTALASGKVNPFLLASMDFVTGTIYVWTGIGTLTWGGHDWTGLGRFANVSAVTLTKEGTAEKITLSLSGIPPEYVDDAINETRGNKIAKLYLGFSDDSGAVISSPVLIAQGYTDVPTLTDSGESCTFSITIETPMVQLQNASLRRYTTDDQKIDYPTDLGFQYVPQIQQWDGVWGKPGSNSAGYSPRPPLRGPGKPAGL